MSKYPLSATNRFRILYRDPQMVLVYNDVEGYSLPVNSEISGMFNGWVSVNLCEAGRCESHNASGLSAVMVPHSCSLSLCNEMPDVFRYPLGYYRGPELYFSLDLLDKPEFILLRESGFSREKWEHFFEQNVYLSRRDPELETLIESLLAIAPDNEVLYKLRLMEVLLHIDRNSIPDDTPPSSYSKRQIAIATAVHDRLIEAPERQYDLKELAAEHGISVTSLNRYFASVYGVPIPAGVLKFRMDLAADFLRNTNLSVMEISSLAGYSNASKFSDAFKREFGCSPTKYRRQER